MNHIYLLEGVRTIQAIIPKLPQKNLELKVPNANPTQISPSDELTTALLKIKTFNLSNILKFWIKSILVIPK